MKKIISILLCICLIGSCLVVDASDNSSNNDTSTKIVANKSGIDFSVAKEVEQWTNVRRDFADMEKEKSNATTTTTIREMAEVYMPEGADYMNVCTIGSTVYIDYRQNNTRYLIAYYSDGTVHKCIRTYGSDDIYSVSSNNPVPKHRDISKTLKRQSITQEEALERMKNLQEGEYEGISVYPIENTNTRATKVVEPISYEDVSSTKPYKKKEVLEGTTYLNSLNILGYNAWQPYTVYETMDYYTEVNKTTQPFSVGETIEYIATLLKADPTMVASWLSLAGVAYTIAGKLEERCEVVAEHEYAYQGGKECGIYDPTANSRKVETYSIWEPGMITLVWEYNSSTGYDNPTWGHSARNLALRTSSTAVRDEGVRIYNMNVNRDGLWKWGVGNGFGN